ANARCSNSADVRNPANPQGSPAGTSAALVAANRRSRCGDRCDPFRSSPSTLSWRPLPPPATEVSRRVNPARRTPMSTRPPAATVPAKMAKPALAARPTAVLVPDPMAGEAARVARSTPARADPVEPGDRVEPGDQVEPGERRAQTTFLCRP